MTFRPPAPIADRRLAQRVAGPLVIAVVFVILAAATWRRWAHLLVDFGRELYVPWRLSEGAALYRDVAYFNGPFSPCLNTLLFRLLGVSMTTLAIANLALTALLATLVYRWFAREFGRAAATLCSLVLLCGFAFAQYDLAANYNFVHPYSHEMTHGLVLSVLLMTLICGNKLSPGRLRLAAAGLCWGLLFLGKAELFVAASAAALLALAIPAACRFTTMRQTTAAATIFLLSGIAPVLIFFLSLIRAMQPAEALTHLCGSWRWVVDPAVTGQHFYLVCSGLDKPLANLVKMAGACSLATMAVAALLIADRWYAGRSRAIWPVLFAVAMLAAVGLLGSRTSGLLIHGRALPVVTLLLCGAFFYSLRKHRGEPAQAASVGAKAVWSVFALLLLAKMPLASRIPHYGFVLAVPATLLLVACLVGYLPTRICRWPGGGRAFRIAAVAVLALDAATLANLSRAQFAQKSLQIAHGDERIYCEPASVAATGPVVQRLLREIENRVPDDATLVVLPEGVMLNYLTRRRNPSRFTNFMPIELAMYGEENILADLQEHAPDFVLLVHKNMAEYGVGSFGSVDYGAKIMAWVDRNYTTQEVVGASQQFGVAVLRRRGG